MFFFEKKNQKTFSLIGFSLAQLPEPDSALKWQKFFGSFFQKTTFFLCGLHKLYQPALRLTLPKQGQGLRPWTPTACRLALPRCAAGNST
jgi:hypothetical protein